MRYYIVGIAMFLMIVGGGLLGAGIAVSATPLIIGGVVGILVSGLVGMASG
jgi:hypothetical protein